MVENEEAAAVEVKKVNRVMIVTVSEGTGMFSWDIEYCSSRMQYPIIQI